MWITAALGVLGKVAGGIFGLKQKQGEIVEGALTTLESVNASDAAYFAASQKAIQTVYTSGGWLERGWRPMLMWLAMALIAARYWGYVPPHLSPVEIEHLYNFIYIGLGGYMPLRSIDKWMQGFQVGNLLKKFVEKKIL